jgi:nucleotide-binding universal stress UspA family protein
MAVAVAPVTGRALRRGARNASGSEAVAGSFQRVLIASEGRPVPDEAIAEAARLAARSGAHVHVLAVARIYGTPFGMTTPGLLPTKKEWAERHEVVASAVRRLKKRGIKADGQVVGTRNAAKRICAEVSMRDYEAVVMSCDPDRNRFVGDLMWTQEPQRVRRRARVPVFLVGAAAADG